MENPIDKINVRPLLRKLNTPKQKEWLQEYIKNGEDGVEAALKVYNIDKKKKNARTSASVMSQKNLKNPIVQEILTEIDEKVNEYFKLEAQSAAKRIVMLSKGSKNDSVQLKANQDILDRAGFKPKDKVQIEPVVNVNHNIPD